MQCAMTLNVQGSAATPWPDPTLLAPVAPVAHDSAAPVAPRRLDQHDVRRVEAPDASVNPYDSMRLQAYRRDAVETAALSTMTPATTATASTTSAPAVKAAPPQVNPLPFQPDVPQRPAAPQSPPPVSAPTAVDPQSGSRPAR